MTKEQMKMIEELKPLLLEVAKKSAELGQYISVSAFSGTMATLTTDNYDIVLAEDLWRQGTTSRAKEKSYSGNPTRCATPHRKKPCKLQLTGQVRMDNK